MEGLKIVVDFYDSTVGFNKFAVRNNLDQVRTLLDSYTPGRRSLDMFRLNISGSVSNSIPGLIIEKPRGVEDSTFWDLLGHTFSLTL